MSHALLSASGSKRWMSCPPSAILEQNFPDQTSSFAEEGTFAHSLAELMLRHYLKEITTRTYNSRLKKMQDNKYFSPDMIDYLDIYVALVAERLGDAKTRCNDPVALLEQKLDFSDWVPEGFGTGDAVIIADGVLEIIDLKYGKGVPVSAENNSQMMLYGLGALNTYEILYDIDLVRMTICQPRLDNISTFEMTKVNLLKWAEEELAPLAKKAFAGEGEFYAGEHCQFCKARYTCRARAEANLELAKMEFAGPELLTDQEVGEVLAKVEELKKWAADVQDYALDQAVNHSKNWPGWKLVEGRSNRKYTDDNSVQKALVKAGYEKEKILKKPELLGITAMEKAIGKKMFNELLSDLVVKPAGKPVLAPESDKRSALNSVQSAVDDFAEDITADEMLS